MDQGRTTANADNGKRRRRLCPGLGLSGKLLLLTTVFVMVAEILIYVPSIANFRIMWLKDRLAAAHTAALVLDAAPSGMVPESLAQQILDSIGAKSVVMKTEQQRRLLVTSKFSPDVVDQEVDVRDLRPMQAIIDAFKTLFISRSGDLVRAVGPAPRGGEFVEIVVEDGPLRHAMLEYSRNILLLSLVISIITAALVYLALLLLFVRPMHRITSNMMAFHRDPEASGGIIVPSRRSDEIGVAERELASMQQDLVSMLKEKSRLASLGLAVSKINHDLRNLLSSAQLFSDRLAGLPDPRVQQFAPKLMRALERAPTVARRSHRRIGTRCCSTKWSKKCARPWGSMVRSAGSPRSNADSWSTPITISCCVSCSILPATPFRRWRSVLLTMPRAIRCASPAGARAPWR
jgi:hypothetical protein